MSLKASVVLAVKQSVELHSLFRRQGCMYGESNSLATVNSRYIILLPNLMIGLDGESNSLPTASSVMLTLPCTIDIFCVYVVDTA